LDANTRIQSKLIEDGGPREHNIGRDSAAYRPEEETTTPWGTNSLFCTTPAVWQTRCGRHWRVVCFCGRRGSRRRRTRSPLAFVPRSLANTHRQHVFSHPTKAFASECRRRLGVLSPRPPPRGENPATPSLKSRSIPKKKTKKRFFLSAALVKGLRSHFPTPKRGHRKPLRNR